MKNIILASNSPRRRELMTFLDVPFSCKSPDVDEVADETLQTCEYVISLAKQKADAVAEKNPGCIVIGSDTVVAYNGKVLGKPADEDDAFLMLKMLSGNCHKVYTGVCITDSEKETLFFEETEVYFRNLTDEEINGYIKTGEPMDKAGAYGIQGKGSLLIEKINGDYFNVVGFPIAKVNVELKKYL